MMNYLFDHIKIEEQMEKLKHAPPFKPGKYEPRFTVTQLFETGVEASISFVLRDGEMWFYDGYQKRTEQ